MRLFTEELRFVVNISLKINTLWTIPNISSKRPTPYKQWQMSNISVTMYGNYIAEIPTINRKFAEMEAFGYCHPGELFPCILTVEIYPNLLVVS
jgi:hypothetical protein